MRTDPIELAFLEKLRSNPRRPMHPSQRRAHVALSPDVVDEAFAFVPVAGGQSRRVDDANPKIQRTAAEPLAPVTNAVSSLGAEKAPRDAALLNSLASQVASLNRKCEELASLLQSLEATSFTE